MCTFHLLGEGSRQWHPERCRKSCKRSGKGENYKSFGMSLFYSTWFPFVPSTKFILCALVFYIFFYSEILSKHLSGWFNPFNTVINALAHISPLHLHLKTREKFGILNTLTSFWTELLKYVHLKFYGSNVKARDDWMVSFNNFLSCLCVTLAHNACLFNGS